MLYYNTHIDESDCPFPLTALMNLLKKYLVSCLKKQMH